MVKSFINFFSKVINRFFSFKLISEIKSSNIHIGSLKPKEPLEKVKYKLSVDYKRLGSNEFKELINKEDQLLYGLEQKKQQNLSLINQQFLFPLLKRAERGYDTGGLYWANQQETFKNSNLHLSSIQEKIDWLKARQFYSSELIKQNSFPGFFKLVSKLFTSTTNSTNQRSIPLTFK